MTERKDSYGEQVTPERKSEPSFEMVTEAVALHELILDENGKPVDYRILSVNPSSQTQSLSEKTPAVGKLASQLYPGSTPPLLDVFSRVSATGEAEHFDTFFEPANRHFSVWVFPTGNGRFATVFEDISERKHTEEALAASEKRLRGILNNAAAGIALVNADGRYMQCNSVWSEMIGYSLEELVDMSYMQVTHPDDVETSKMNHDALVRGQSESYGLEKRYVRKDGEVFWADISVSSIRDHHGDLEGTVVVILDITERKKTVEALRVSEERYRSLVENAGYGIIILDLVTSEILFVNKRCMDLMGRTEEEIVGKPIWDFLDRSDHEKAADRLKAYSSGGSLPPGPEKFTYLHGDGSKRRLEITASVATYHDKNALQCIFSDITEQELLQKQLQHSQKMEALGTLAGGVAHEFNNILMAIRGYAQMLVLKTVLSQEEGRILGKITESTERAGELTQKMLGFARLEAGQMARVNMNRVVESVQGLMRQTFPPEIEIETNLASNLPDLFANSNELEQVLVNLSVNARDAMPQGGKITIRTSLLQADESFCRAHPWAMHGKYVELVVEDTGEGMTTDVLEHVFDPFFTTKAPGRGTGLGLSVAHTMIANHLGSILADSTPGKGTRFLVYLPVTENMTFERESTREHRPPPMGSGQPILVVDDDDSVREVCKYVLEEFGYQVFEASNGRLAFDMYRLAMDEGRPYALVVLDLTMPIMGGMECYDKIAEIHKEARIIFVTGHGSHKYDTEPPGQQVVSVLRKPFDLHTLITEVARGLASPDQ
jgi:two-component system cell cycle sensor histidine kinase/response regulator CckA